MNAMSESIGMSSEPERWFGAPGARGVVSGLLVDQFGVRPELLSSTARLDEDLCLDSLELVDFGLMLESRTGIALGVEVLSLAKSLSDLVDLVEAASRPDEC